MPTAKQTKAQRDRLNKEFGGVDLGETTRERTLKRDRAGIFRLEDELGDKHEIGPQAEVVFLGVKNVRALFENNQLACGAHQDNDWRPHTSNPRASHCDECVHKADKSCKFQAKAAVLPVVNGAFEEHPHVFYLKGNSRGDFYRVVRACKAKGINLAGTVVVVENKKYTTTGYGDVDAAGFAYKRDLHEDEFSDAHKAREEAQNSLLAAPALPGYGMPPLDKSEPQGTQEPAQPDDDDDDGIPF